MIEKIELTDELEKKIKSIQINDWFLFSRIKIEFHEKCLKH